MATATASASLVRGDVCRTAPKPAGRVQPPPACRFDRQFWLLLFLTTAVLVPRSFLIARAHSESCDDDYHLARGLAFWTRTIGARDLDLNDPPLAEGLIALPMLATNLLTGRAADDCQLYDQPGRAELVARGVALGNAALALPLFALVFLWCRHVYGARSAWLASTVLLVDPTITALIPIPVLDILGVEGILLGCWLAWRYFEAPTTPRLVACGLGIGLALMLKHTAVALPPVVLALAALHWVAKPWWERQEWGTWRAALGGRVRALATLGVLAVASIWALSLFDVSPPISRVHSLHAESQAHAAQATPARSLRVATEKALRLTEPWPAGSYLRAFRSGLGHGIGGHACYLFGERRVEGWRYYFPAVATYKVPLGIGAVLLLGLVSVAWDRPRWAEWGLFIPCVAWGAFMINSKVNIGFRHFLPAYVFLIMLSSRCLASRANLWSIAAWTALAMAGLHVASYHPDYLCYINFPRHKPYLAISDSNVDWGQSLKQVREWIDARPAHGRPVSLYYFGKTTQPNVEYYLGDRVRKLTDRDPPPTDGLLIISPVQEAGVYDARDAYAALRSEEPIAMIGHSMLVYDLDALGRGKPFEWTPGGRASDAR
ncbi:MAG: hypothetical protein P4L84_14005 [Isosphaeraceae bacterium]|nr:hypothetical protein [Isosphaeraceae bacterium]